MGKRGPKPTPTAILKARGSWRGNRNRREPMPQLGMSSAPKHIRDDTDAYAEWRRVVPHLSGMGVLAYIDRSELESYCISYAQHKRAVKTMNELRRTNPGKAVEQSDAGRQIVKQMRALRSEMTRLSASFGMTPSSRSRITTGGDEGNEGENNRTETAVKTVRRAIDFVRAGG